MTEQMEFPETFEEFAKEYGFKDSEEIYTNGSDLIPIFRVKQWLEHNNKLHTIYLDKEVKTANDLLNKIKSEIKDTLYIDSLIFGELIDFRNGKLSADDVIEEFNRVTRIEVLKIIDKYKIESEKQK